MDNSPYRLSAIFKAERDHITRWRGVFLASLCKVRGVLPADLQSQLNGGRDLLARLRDAFTRFSASAEDQAALAASVCQLDEFFMLVVRSEEHTSELQSRLHLVCRLLLEKKK